jgi:hypothetical protein
MAWQVNDAIDKILRSRHTTCLFVAHRLSTIARAERIVVLEGALYLHLVCFPGMPLTARLAASIVQMDISPRPGRTASL